jgi:hypothetical protein
MLRCTTHFPGWLVRAADRMGADSDVALLWIGDAFESDVRLAAIYLRTLAGSRSFYAA